VVQNVNKKSAENQEDNDEEESDDGIDDLLVGPDGYPLFRNPSDLMNNFFINVAALSFTDIQKNLKGNVNTYEIKRLKRYEREINDRKDLWKENTVGTFLSQA